MAWRSGWRGGRRAGCSSPQATAAGSHRPSLPCAADRLGRAGDRAAPRGWGAEGGGGGGWGGGGGGAERGGGAGGGVWGAAARGKAARWGALPAPVVLWGAWYLALAREAGCPRQWARRWWAVCWWRRPGCHHRPPACRPAAWRPFP